LTRIKPKPNPEKAVAGGFKSVIIRVQKDFDLPSDLLENSPLEQDSFLITPVYPVIC